MENIDRKIAVWKNKLLDLGKRNKLINYKHSTKSSLIITFPSYEDLFDSLVRNECSLDFPRPHDSDDEESNELQMSLWEDNGHSLGYGNDEAPLRTDKKIPELQRVLRLLRSKAKTAIEEQGINVLYLCFGFLNWAETKQSDIIYSSPLVLVPVKLTVESISSPFVLSLHEDEIVVNPTLAYKLYSDFGLSLPEFDESKPLSDYFDAVRKITGDQKWTVSTEVGLNTLSFLKINMYEDLNKHNDSIAACSFVRALCGDREALGPLPEGINDYNFDKEEKPQNVFQIVDADASQQEAILYAKKGVSFILHGPPGTGKSQTITNIIAEFLAEGKNVLFVSEKMAALEVVYKRLSAAGLADFCLVLHSHKTNKRSVLDQLENVLNLSMNKATMAEEAFQKLDALQADKDKLNAYAEQLFSIVKPLGKTIYEANGIIADLDEKGYKDLIFSLPQVRQTTREQYSRYLYLLEQFAATIGKMTEDYKTNPWRGSILPAVTNEFRHDARVKISEYLPILSGATKDVQEAFSLIDSVYPVSLQGIEQAEIVLGPLSRAFVIPAAWVTEESNGLADEIEEYSNLQKDCHALAAKLEGYYHELDEHGVLSAVPTDAFLAVETQREQKQFIQNTLCQQAPYFRWVKKDRDSITQIFEAAKTHANEIHRILATLTEQYEPGLFEIDYEGVLARYKTEYTSFFKRLKKSYKEDRNLFIVNRKQVGAKLSDAEILDTINSLRELAMQRQWYTDNSTLLSEMFGDGNIYENSDYNEIAIQLSIFDLLCNTRDTLEIITQESDRYLCKEEELKDHFEFLFNGLFTDWDDIREAVHWAGEFRSIIADYSPSQEFVEKVCRSKEYADQCYRQREVLQNARNRIENGLRWFADCFESPDDFRSVNLEDLYERITECGNNMAMLEEWIDFRAARENCFASGLSSYVSAIADNNIPVADILPVFKKRFFRLWLDAVLPDYPAVLNFRRKQQERTIRDFSVLDTTQFQIAKARIKGKLISDLPSVVHITNGTDEMSILTKELTKQRKIMPIRKLFMAIPNLLVKLKPCLMMSPLSVSLFLEADSYKFDVVIFDEASQVCTENAIGAISRGKQVIIAGDRKQLPPTNFFQATTSENQFDYDSDEDDESEVYDSILDEACTLPECQLRWHYRSRHESLIAFSNANIYRNSLITFPSNIEQQKDNGVEYVFVPGGRYQKGNTLEAEKVAELVFEHMKTQPERSLGVIAFGEDQQYAIESAIRELRLKHQDKEMFFSEEKEEAFFVKNLENVQGDERDTIIFSIGYAPDPAGKFRMNFGPLSKAGGERRLNVAITRAKYNVKLVGSIRPTDINVDAITMDGPKLLRAYIDYAMNGSDALRRTITAPDHWEFDSPFEEAVCHFLDKKGYRLSTQVGCSGYRIDIGVRHPSISGVYVLGVECDGASYHSARTARERDRLRQDVLESMGWSIYRIWSTDWIKDPVTEGQKLVDAIEDAIRNFANRDQSFHSAAANEGEENYLQVTEKSAADYDVKNIYGFSESKPTDFSRLPRKANGYLDLKDCINAVIENEYPVHYDLLCQRIAPLLGYDRITNTVRKQAAYALDRMDSYERKGDFFFPKGYTNIPVRYPNTRKIQHIHTEELAAAMVAIMKTCVGITRDALANETSQAYWFNRRGTQIKAAMTTAIQYLIDNNLIEEIEGKLRLK